MSPLCTDGNMLTTGIVQAYFRAHGPQRTAAQVAQQRAELLANVPDEQRKNLDERTLQVKAYRKYRHAPSSHCCRVPPSVTQQQQSFDHGHLQAAAHCQR